MFLFTSWKPCFFSVICRTALGVGSLLVTWGMFLKFPRETLLPQNVFSTNPTFLLITLYLTMFSIEQKFTLTLQLEQVKTFHLGRKTQDPSTVSEGCGRGKRGWFSKDQSSYFHRVLRNGPRSSRTSFCAFSPHPLPCLPLCSSSPSLPPFLF